MPNRWSERERSWDEGGYPDRDRGLVRRAGDEVRSWFGDDEAARRRRMDELREDRDNRRGVDEWADDDREWRNRPSYYSGSGRWRDSAALASRDRDDRERSFGDTSRYATADPFSAPGWSRPLRERRPDATAANYTGRGPRGYTRSDERIREDVCDRLTDDARIDASDIEVHVRSGEVTLAGSVSSRGQKRFTEDVAEDVLGVREVNNNLKVKPLDEVIGTARSGATLGVSETPTSESSRTR